MGPRRYVPQMSLGGMFVRGGGLSGHHGDPVLPPAAVRLVAMPRAQIVGPGSRDRSSGNTNRPKGGLINGIISPLKTRNTVGL